MRRERAQGALKAWRAGGWHGLGRLGRRRRDTFWTLACLTLTAVILAGDIVGSGTILIGLFVVPPLLASTRTGPWQTAFVGTVSVTIASLAGVWDQFMGTSDHLVRIAAVAAGSAVAVWAAWIREHAFFQRRRAELVAEATTVLSTSLDYEQTLRTVTELAVPALADIASIDLMESDGSLRRIALAGDEHGASTPLAYRLGRSPGDHVISATIESGRAQLIEDVSADLIDAAAGTGGERPEAAQLKLRSVMFVPLTARGRVLGAMGFATRHAGRRYGPGDLRFAEDLAARAAMAIDNARLYSDLRTAEAAKESSLSSERSARAAAEAGQRLSAYLAETSVILDASLNMEDTLQAIARLPIPDLADLCVIDLFQPDGSIHGLGVAATDPEVADALRELRQRYPLDPAGSHPVAQVLRSGEPKVLPAMSEETLAGLAAGPEHLAFMLKTRYHSAAVAPLRARGRTLGVISLLHLSTDASYGMESLQFVTEVARRAALALDNAQLYGERDETARVLQQGLMPPALPAIEGADVAAGYWPGARELDVGGDFYDVFERGDDVFVAVGDVCGKGARAAALTGLARHILRAASVWEPRPAATLSALNQAVLEENTDDRFLTAVLCALRFRDDGIDVTLACGGHPPALVLSADGVVAEAGVPGTLIGVVADPSFSDHHTRLEAGDALVLYTDGITEAPVAGGRFGAERLAEVVAGCAGLHAAAIADRIEQAALRKPGLRRHDDAVVLVVRAV